MQKPYRTSPYYRVHQYKGEQWRAHRNPHSSLHMAEVQSLKRYIKQSLQVLLDAIISKISQLEIMMSFFKLPKVMSKLHSLMNGKNVGTLQQINITDNFHCNRNVTEVIQYAMDHIFGEKCPQTTRNNRVLLRITSTSLPSLPPAVMPVADSLYSHHPIHLDLPVNVT